MGKTKQEIQSTWVETERTQIFSSPLHTPMRHHQQPWPNSTNILHLDPQCDACSPLGLDSGAGCLTVGGSVAQQGRTHTIATSVSYLHLLTSAA